MIYFSSIKDLRKALTEKRLELLKIIKKTSSMYELAKIAGRNLKNILQDVEYLHRIGLVEIRCSKEGKEKNTPMINY